MKKFMFTDGAEAVESNLVSSFPLLCNMSWKLCSSWLDNLTASCSWFMMTYYVFQSLHMNQTAIGMSPAGFFFNNIGAGSLLTSGSRHSENMCAFFDFSSTFLKDFLSGNLKFCSLKS